MEELLEGLLNAGRVGREMAEANADGRAWGGLDEQPQALGGWRLGVGRGGRGSVQGCTVGPGCARLWTWIAVAMLPQGAGWDVEPKYAAAWPPQFKSLRNPCVAQVGVASEGLELRVAYVVYRS